tara:strand:- start:3799 stop:6966 length:3168 start_codon:yes stop_codon:yes gene_type:complete
MTSLLASYKGLSSCFSLILFIAMISIKCTVVTKTSSDSSGVISSRNNIHTLNQISDAPLNDPSRALANIDLYPGLEATLFSSEPMIINPVNLDIDHRGRVWVCDVVNYRHRATENKRPEGDRILILEDYDGDGIADTSKVFYQGRDIDAPLGLAVIGNKVIVTVAPNVIVFTDEDGDDKPDKKEFLFTKTGPVQAAHSTHSFSFGPDGKLYWNMGNGGFHIHDADGKSVIDQWGFEVFGKDALGRMSEDSFEKYKYGISPYYGGMVFRCDLDGSSFEVLGHNFRNIYEVAVDSYGNLWQSDNDDDGHAACRFNFVLEFGNYGYKDEITGAGWQNFRTGWDDSIEKRHWHQNDPGVVPNIIITGGGSPTGITVYEGRLLPEIFWDNVIYCDAGPGVVWSPQLKKYGAGYKAEIVNLFKGERDKSIRPIDVAVAPDGSIFISDWYDPVLGWSRQEEPDRGRIFRIAPIGNKYILPEYDFTSAEGAIEALKSPNHSVRSIAWNSLHNMQSEAESELVKLFNSGNPRFKARALWLLSKIQKKGDKYITIASKDLDENIRITAIRAARQLDTDIIPLLKSMVTDVSPHVRRECAIALREIKSKEVPKLWTELALRHDGQDRWYLEALGIGAEGRWDSIFAEWLASVGDGWNEKSGRDIIWRSRAINTSEYLMKIINSSDVSLEDTARYLRAFDFQRDSPYKMNILKKLVLESPNKGSPKHTFVATEALMRIDDFDIHSNQKVRNSINDLLTNAEGTVQFTKLVKKYELTEYYPSLMTIVTKKINTQESISAIKVLLDANLNEIIKEFLTGSDTDIALKTAIALGNARDSRNISLLKSAFINNKLPRAVREQSVRALVQTPKGGLELIKLAKEGNFPESYKDIVGKAMSNSMNVAMHADAAKYFPLPPTKNNNSLPGMTELLVYVGNPENGKMVFETSGCNNCHVVNGEGIDFGPNLSKAGNKLSKLAFYQSIIDPSAGIAPSYKQYSIELKNNEEIVGFIISETSDVLKIKSEGGIITDVNQTDIVTKKELSISAMPSNLQYLMSVDELVDLVEFMISLK